MIVRATATFTGRDALGRFAETKITPGIIAGINQWLRLVKDEAQRLAPVGETGDLREGIVIVPIEDTGKTVRGSVASTVDYSGYNEYGTGQRGAASPGRGPYPYKADWPGMPAQPYLRPASDHVEEEGRARLVDEISTRIK